jgi:hypothetical protein
MQKYIIIFISIFKKKVILFLLNFYRKKNNKNSKIMNSLNQI